MKIYSIFLKIPGIKTVVNLSVMALIEKAFVLVFIANNQN